MNIQFNRRKIETFFCILIVFILIIVLAVLAIFAVADGIFAWDILTGRMEKVAMLFMSVLGIIIVAAFLINLMTNLSLISISFERIAENLTKNKNDGQ